MLHALLAFANDELDFLFKEDRFELWETRLEDELIGAIVVYRSANIALRIGFRVLPNRGNESGVEFSWLKHRSDSGVELMYPFSRIRGMGRMVEERLVPRFAPFPSAEAIERLERWVFQLDDLAGKSDTFWEQRKKKAYAETVPFPQEWNIPNLE